MDPLIANVRKRPGMYVGDCDDGSGLLHMLLELVANAFDQHLAGRCSWVDIQIDADGTITVEDDGPGIPAGGGNGLPSLDLLLTRLSDLPTVDGHRPHAHLGQHGIGMCPVNALCEHLELVTVHAGIEARVRCSRGELLAPVVTVATTRPSGTRVRLQPDRSLFGHTRISRLDLTRELEDLSFLVPGLRLSWRIAGDQVATAGLVGRVAVTAPCPSEDVAHHRGEIATEAGPIDVDVALTWRIEGARIREDAVIESFVNLHRTKDAGSHVDGLLDGIRAFIGGRNRKHDTAGLVAAVSVILPDVKFGTPARDLLVNPEAGPAVRAATLAALTEWATKHPDAAAQVRTRAT